MSADTLLPLVNHLWQSTLFVIAAWLVALSLRKNRAAVRHRLWLAASVKFLIPFSLLTNIGSYFQWETPVTTPRAVSMLVEPFSGSFVAPPGTTSATQDSPLASVLIGVWICGVAANLVWWFGRWRQVRQAVRLAAPSNLAGPLRVMYGPTRFEPGVFGIFRPVLLLPEGITDRLSPAQLQAVLAHEFCHVRRRDNLVMGVHMVVEAVFWFHPLVWLIKVRLLEEQERACDEEVLRLGGDAQVYAESILKICEFYLTSPLICVSGISGSNLKRRIEDIMRNQAALKLSLSRSLLLVVAGIAALAGPIIVGVKAVAAQSEAEVRPVTSPIGTAVEPPSSPPTVQLIVPRPVRRRSLAPRQDNGGRGVAELQRLIQEEYRLGEIRVAGAKVVSNDVIRSLMAQVPGEFLDESGLRKGFQDLQKLYGSLGYANFLAEPALDFDEQKKIVNLTVYVDEGPQFTVNRISFAGNTITPDEVLRREIPIKEGQVFNASLLDLSRLRLNQLGLFEEIRVEDFRVQPSPNEPKLDITLRVQEKGR